ncbi:unnamed protein product, partial [Cuscuta campestris]
VSSNLQASGESRLRKTQEEEFSTPLLSQGKKKEQEEISKFSKILSEKRSSNFFIHSSKEKRKNFNSIGETRRRNHHKFLQNPGSSKPSSCEPFSYILTSLFQSDF